MEFKDRSGGVHNSYDYSRDKEPLNGYKRGAQDLRYRLVIGVHRKYSQLREYPRSSLNAMTKVHKKHLSVYSPREPARPSALAFSDRIHPGVLAKSFKCPRIALVRDIFDSPRSRGNKGMGTSATL